jgi:hypothetical protein
LATQDFHLSEALKDAIHWQRVSRYDAVTAEMKKWLQVQNLNWYTKGIDVRVGSSRSRRKTRCVIHPSSYPMSRLKEIYKKNY